jgi:hypothetical protein
MRLHAPRRPSAAGPAHGGGVRSQSADAASADIEPPPVLDIEAQLREARAENVTLDATTTMAFAEAIERASAAFSERPDVLDRLEALESLVTIVGDAELPVDLRRPQNRYYRMRATVRPAIAASTGSLVELFDSLRKLTIAPQLTVGS